MAQLIADSLRGVCRRLGRALTHQNHGHRSALGCWCTVAAVAEQGVDMQGVKKHRVDVLVVGAGMTGLTAALTLAQAGKRVRVVDKGRTVGGRLATRRIGRATLDHGAQFFTVRSDEFRHAVDLWQADGIVGVWSHGFDSEDPDGHPRYRTEGGMSKLAKHLAEAVISAGAQIVLKERVQSLIDTGNDISAIYDGGSRLPDEAAAVLVTAPVPQIVDMLESGGIPVPDAARLVTYNEVIALLATTDADIAKFLGPSGALQQPLDPMFTFIADNRAKGISKETGLTLHVEPALSSALWNCGDAEILERLTPELIRVFGNTKMKEMQVKKWRYAAPRNGHPDRFLAVDRTSHPLVMAGDAFGGAKVEGAFLSGRRAAEYLLAHI